MTALVALSAESSFAAAVQWTRSLVAIAAAVNAMELLVIARLLQTERTWRDDTLANGWGPLRLLLETRRLPWLALVQMLAAAGLAFVSAWGLWCALLLCLTTLLVATRFRGTLNGGSDGMLFTVLGGLVLAQLSPAHPRLRDAGLLYVAAQLTLSYVRAGVVKCRQRAWWTGEAMAAFLALPAYGVPTWVPRDPALLRAVGIAVLVFECAAPLAWLHPDVALTYLAGAFVFHIATAVLFGLNRFVLAWTAAMPALWYAVQRA